MVGSGDLTAADIISRLHSSLLRWGASVACACKIARCLKAQLGPRWRLGSSRCAVCVKHAFYTYSGRALRAWREAPGARACHSLCCALPGAQTPRKQAMQADPASVNLLDSSDEVRVARINAEVCGQSSLLHCCRARAPNRRSACRRSQARHAPHAHTLQADQLRSRCKALKAQLEQSEVG